MNSDFQSGSLASVGSSDNSRLSIGYNRSTRIGKDGSATIQFTSTFPTLPDLALRVYVEAKATGRGMKQQISLWNYTTNAFDIVDTRPATSADTFALARTE